MDALRAVVIGVGDELLEGVVVNTNAADVGSRLLSVGIRVVESVCVGDDEEAIASALRRAVAAAEVVVVTGGLGPTPDDRTREALARALGVPLRRDPALQETIRRAFVLRGRPFPPSNERQADVPEGASPIPNRWGTAPGIRAELDGAVVYAIPGVPREARHMLDEHVVPELAERFGGGRGVAIRLVRCVGLPESEIAERLADLAAAAEPRLSFLPGGGEVRLRFVATGTDRRACEAALDRAERQVRQRLGPAVYGTDDQTLEAVVGLLVGGSGLTLATAESCTAGLLAARITSVPGSSNYFRGGVVAYQSEVKARALGISPSLVESAGPVSGEVAVEMARGAKHALEADLALSITCAAGPEPQGGAAPGTVFLGLAGLGRTEVVRQLAVPGDREQVREFAVTFALNLLRLHLLGEPLR